MAAFNFLNVHSIYFTLFDVAQFPKRNKYDDLIMIINKLIVVEDNYMKLLVDLTRKRPYVTVSLKQTTGDLPTMLALLERVELKGSVVIRGLMSIDMNVFNREVISLREHLDTCTVGCIEHLNIDEFVQF